MRSRRYRRVRRTNPGSADAAPSADPYANNAAPGATAFPLAAPAGKDSGARTTAPAGAVNQGPFDPATWKYGTAFDPPPGAKIWNPVKLKMMAGGKVTGGTVFSATDPATYCAMANAGYDFIWTEMQHNQRDWEAVARMWRTCPNAKAVPGVRVAYTDEREIQHALDAGALVMVVPTVDTRKRRSKRATGPTSRRSAGAATAAARRSSPMWGGVPGGYRNTINDNIVLILMIETLEGVKNADEIAKVPACRPCSPPAATSATSPASGRARPTTSAPSTSSTTPRIKAGKRLCGPFAWRDRPDFTCFQAGSETAAIARGVAAELGRWPTRRASPRSDHLRRRPSLRERVSELIRRGRPMCCLGRTRWSAPTTPIVQPTLRVVSVPWSR